jgi:glycosyltransferase involved in cell wall biosynthesis
MLREKPDIYVGHGYGSLMPFLASIAALINGKPFVFTLHGYPEVRGRKRMFYHFYRFFIAPVFLHIAKKVIVVSRSNIGRMENEAGKNKIIYIPNGIEGRFDCELNYRDKNTLLYVGRLSEDKGIDVLLRAFAKIKNKYPELTLKLVGKDEGEKSKLEELARSLDINPIFSTVPYDKMPSIYAESKAVILPSRYEGLSLIWLESMSSGRPMFSTPVGEANAFFEQAYDKNKDLFLFKGEDELAEKLTAFLDNQENYKKIVEKAKYIVRDEYSWKNVASQTRAVYEELLG